MTKVSAVKERSIDYFKLPFEVHYSDAVPVTTLDFKSDLDDADMGFEDVKIVHMEQGSSFGLTFICNENNGPELYCCLKNYHDEAVPDWLNFEEENDMDFNFGCDYAVVVEGHDIYFVTLTDEQEDEESDDFLDVENMDVCNSLSFLEYELSASSPDYIILDALNSKIKIDLDGYALDDAGSRIASQRVINVDELDDEEYEDFQTKDMFDAKFDWVKSVIEKDFPQDANLELNPDTE